MQVPELHRSFKGKCANVDRGEWGAGVGPGGLGSRPKTCRDLDVCERRSKTCGEHKGWEADHGQLQGVGETLGGLAQHPPPPRNPVLYLNASGTAEVGVIK